MEIIEYGTSWLIEDQLNTELLNDIKFFFDNHLDFLYKNKKGYSTSGNNVEQYWIKNEEFYYSNKEYCAIERKYRKEVLKKLKTASLLTDDQIQLEQKGAWSVMGEEGSYHTIHIHSDGKIDEISTVLYLNVPEISPDNIESNLIYLVLHTDPSGNFINQPCPSIYHIKPKVGKLLIFPSYIPHGTYPQTKGIRQTFNVDYKFKYEKKIISDINYM